METKTADLNLSLLLGLYNDHVSPGPVSEGSVRVERRHLAGYPMGRHRIICSGCFKCSNTQSRRLDVYACCFSACHSVVHGK